MPQRRYKSAIEACGRCAQECEHYASEFAGSIGNCVRLCVDTAQLCRTTASFLSRGSQFTPAITKLCAEVCQACAMECEKAPDALLGECAAICRNCAEECLKIADEQPPEPFGTQGSGVSASVVPVL